MIFFQGLEDTIVPANQSEMIYERLEERGIPTAYVAFPGEYHGFTQAENIKRSLEAELYFYSRIFNFPLAEQVEPVRIANLDKGVREIVSHFRSRFRRALSLVSRLKAR